MTGAEKENRVYVRIDVYPILNTIQTITRSKDRLSHKQSKTYRL